MVQPADYVHLHVHSDYSLLDGAAKVESLVAAAKRAGHSALALTDHGTLSGAVAFHEACTKEGIKPILGCEAYLAPGDEKDAHKLKRERPVEERAPGETGRDYAHVTLLAKDETGWQNLTRLATAASLEGFYHRPRICWELLKAHHKGLVVLSGCLKGPVSAALKSGRIDTAMATIRRYHEVFGEDYYLEVQPNSIPEQAVVNDGSLRLGGQHGIKLVAACDLHYVDPADAGTQEVKICIVSGKKLADNQHLRMTPEFYFRSTEDVYRAFSHHPQAVLATREVAEKVQSYDILPGKKGRYFLPKFQPPDGTSGPVYLRRLCEEGLRRRYGPMAETHRQRLEYELGVIERMGFVDYFLIVADIIRWAKENGCPCGPGRGSAAGSIVSYCIGITALDPIRYGLLFERFLNPDRKSMPDIDSDFDERNRGRVIEYVRRKYGDDCVAQIATFGELKAKSSLKDAARVLDVPIKEAEAITSAVPEMPGMGLEQALEASAQLRAFREDVRYTRLFEVALRLEGLLRTSGVHPAGVVVGDVPLVQRVPLVLDTKTKVVKTAFTMTEVEKVGLVKMDLLGLRTITQIYDCVRLVERTTGVRLDPDELPLRDHSNMAETAGAHPCPVHLAPFARCRCCDLALEVYRRGACGGVFQVEGEGLRQLLVDIKVDRFDDVVAACALYRPGPMGTGMHESYARRKNGLEPVEVDHPALEAVLAETYGLPVYQESIMKLSVVVAGFTPGQSDDLRKATAKKDAGKMAKIGPAFIDGCVKHGGLHRDKAEEIWKKIVHFAEYSFNKSHSAAYAKISWQTAWLKANYPAEFMAALMTSQAGASEKLMVYVDEARRMGIPVEPPDVNESMPAFDVRTDGCKRIVYGFLGIKGLGEAAATEVVRARSQVGGRFWSFLHLCETVDHAQVTAGDVKLLAQAGALRSVARAESVLPVVEQVMKSAAATRKAAGRGQTFLFGAAGGATERDRELDDSVLARTAPDMDPALLLAMEKEALGFHLTASPLDGWRDAMELYSTAHCGKLGEAADVVTICGILTTMRRHVDKKGQEMGFFTVEDFTGSVECTAFASTWPQVVAHMRPDAKLAVTGKVQKRGERVGVLVSKVETLTRACQAAGVAIAKAKAGEEVRERTAEKARQAPPPGWSRRVEIEFPAALATTEALARVVQALRENPGHDRVHYSFVQPGHGRQGPFELQADGGGAFGVMADQQLVEKVRTIAPPGTRVSLGTVVGA